MAHVKRVGLSVEHRRNAVVLVLVDHNHSSRDRFLIANGRQKPGELVVAVDSRHDQINVWRLRKALVDGHSPASAEQHVSLRRAGRQCLNQNVEAALREPRPHLRVEGTALVLFHHAHLSVDQSNVFKHGLTAA